MLWSDEDQSVEGGEGWTASTLIPLVHLFFRLKPALAARQGEQVAITGWRPMSKDSAPGQMGMRHRHLPASVPALVTRRLGMVRAPKSPLTWERDPGATAGYRLG